MYRCIKGFALEICNDDGFTVENEYMPIAEGSIWEVPEDENFRLIGGDIRLERFDSNIHDWIEISEETLEEHFEIIEEELLECEECGAVFKQGQDCDCIIY